MDTMEPHGGNSVLPDNMQGSGVVTAVIMCFTLMVYNYSPINCCTAELRAIKALVLHPTIQLPVTPHLIIFSVVLIIVSLLLSLLFFHRPPPTSLTYLNTLARLQCNVAPNRGWFPPPPRPFKPVCVERRWISATLWSQRSAFFLPFFSGQITAQFNGNCCFRLEVERRAEGGLKPLAALKAKMSPGDQRSDSSTGVQKADTDNGALSQRVCCGAMRWKIGRVFLTRLLEASPFVGPIVGCESTNGGR